MGLASSSGGSPTLAAGMVSALCMTKNSTRLLRVYCPRLFSSATLAAIWLLDGLGFGIAYVGTRSLVASTLWHACKNLAVWMTGGFVFQFVPGLLRFASFGHTEHVRYLDLLFSAVMAAAALALVRKRLRYVV